MWVPGDPRRLGDWCPVKGCGLLLTGLRSDKKTYYCLNGHEHVNPPDTAQDEGGDGHE